MKSLTSPAERVKNFKLYILRKGAEGSTLTKAEALGVLGRSFVKLEYSSDGANYTLYATGFSLINIRRGEISVTFSLFLGRVTECRIVGGGLNGAFPLECKSYKATFSADSCKIECVYLVQGESITLEITANTCGKG